MATMEFYIRNASDTDARGPFSFEQLQSMAETGLVTLETKYYDANSEKWITLGDNAELKAQVFPEKKKLSIKRDAEVQTLNKPEGEGKALDVRDMLAAAEGKTEDTRDKAGVVEEEEHCAKAGIYGCVLILLLAAASETLPSVDIISNFAPDKLLDHPLIFLGAIDLALAVLLGLGLVSLYPFIRFRAMLGLGFVGGLFYLGGRFQELTAVVAASVGLYVCTILLRYIPMAFALVLGIGGAGALAWIALNN